MNQPAHLPLNPLDRVAIERIVSGVLRGREIGLKLFGSRARGDARQASDIDLAMMAKPDVSLDELAEIREALEASNIPYRIDLLDYTKVSDSLRRAIDAEGLAWPAQNSA
jgi:predicted nucleotidyltransferase